MSNIPILYRVMVIKKLTWGGLDLTNSFGNIKLPSVNSEMWKISDGDTDGKMLNLKTYMFEVFTRNIRTYIVLLISCFHKCTS